MSGKLKQYVGNNALKKKSMEIDVPVHVFHAAFFLGQNELMERKSHGNMFETKNSYPTMKNLNKKSVNFYKIN